MCRSIKPLFNYDPPASDEEIRAAAVQYVRKISGSRAPSQVNQRPFERAVEQIARASAELLDALQTRAPPRDREVEAARARQRRARRSTAPGTP